MRRTQHITKKPKISLTTHVHCYNRYMVNNNRDQRLRSTGFLRAGKAGRARATAELAAATGWWWCCRRRTGDRSMNTSSSPQRSRSCCCCGSGIDRCGPLTVMWLFVLASPALPACYYRYYRFSIYPSIHLFSGMDPGSEWNELSINQSSICLSIIYGSFLYKKVNFEYTES